MNTTLHCDWCQHEIKGQPVYLEELPGVKLCDRCKARHHKPERSGRYRNWKRGAGPGFYKPASRDEKRD